MIGSLLWDQAEHRTDWRKSLRLEDKIPVAAPIRYGRVSTTRSNTFTMVFSNDLVENGKAWFVPYRLSVENFAELRDQALAMAVAEGIATVDAPNRLVADLGAIALKYSTTRPRPDMQSLAEQWRTEFGGLQPFDFTGFCVDGECPVLTPEGILDVPIEIPVGYDYALAAATVANVDRYPSPDEIVAAIDASDPPYEEYIRENIRHGIEVADHEPLMKLRPSLKPHGPK